MNRRRLLQRIQSGAVANIAIRDVEDLLVGLGFSFERIHGSHRIYRHPGVPRDVNLQPSRGNAKGYQVRQIAKLVEAYNLQLED
jgi:predicted RNA binding protein YcfA (HicA-like mRNA interferase family)